MRYKPIFILENKKSILFIVKIHTANNKHIDNWIKKWKEEVLNMAKKKIKAVSLEEQETTINADYFAQTVDVFTSNKAVYEKWCKDLGEPTKLAKEKEKIVGGIWRISFVDRQKIKKVFSILNVIPK